MNMATGIFFAFALAVSITALPVFADVNDTHYSPIQFKSKKIARWQLTSMYRVQSTTETYLYDNTYTYPAGSQGIFSASRRFNTWVPQKVYATYKTNNTALAKSSTCINSLKGEPEPQQLTDSILFFLAS